MAKSVIELGVKDSGFNARIKDAMRAFASLGNAANNAKGQFAKFADGIAQVAQSQQMLNAALKGNPYGLMAQAATMAFTKIIELSTQASEAEMRAANEAQRKAEIQQTANEAIGRSTGELMAKYELLRVQWNSLSNEQQRIEWIEQNKSAFKSLNLAVNDVTSAENVFVKNTEKVVAALQVRAKAEAYAELYKDQVKKNALNKATGQYNPTKSAKIGDRPTLMEASLAGITDEDYIWETRKVHDRYGRPGTIRESRGLNKSGVAKMNQLYSMGAASRENADRMQADYWAGQMALAQQEAITLSKGLFGPVGGGGGRGGKGGSGKTEIDYAADSIMAQEKEVARLTQLWKTAGEAVRDDYKVQLDEAKKKLEEMTNPMGPQMKLWQGDIDDIAGGPGKTPTFANGIPQIGEGLKNVPKLLSPLQEINAEIEHWQELMQYAPTSDAYQVMKQHLEELMKKQKEFTGETEQDVKGTNAAWNSAASVIRNVGSAISSIEDPSAKIIGMIAEAVATIALGFSQAIGKDVGEKGNVWYGIAAAAAGVASMISTISAIHSATGYAQGGIVDGRSYSGDNIPILANAGEVVLTRAMQNNLATQLQGGGFGNMNLTATISGEQIRLALNNNGRRTGRGEYVTTNFR